MAARTVINDFTAAITRLGVESHNTFEPNDLYENRNMPQVRYQNTPHPT
jgi:hypothetical protein